MLHKSVKLNYQQNLAIKGMRTPPRYPLLPGPTVVTKEVLDIHGYNYLSSDTEPEFWTDYFALEKSLQQILNTVNDIAILSGEGMIALWGAMKSVVNVNDNVVCVVNGIYGEGFASIAESLGACVVRVNFPWDHPIESKKVIQTIQEIKPKLVTMVHCETPTGVLNSLSGIGEATRGVGGLFLVDFVSSAGGVEINVDEENIDLGLLGSQKVLSAPPSLSFVSISLSAWSMIQETKYQGYDSLLPFHQLRTHHFLPYTHNWHAIAATLKACQQLIDCGLENSWKRHLHARNVCLEKGKLMRLEVFSHATLSPTVTAFRIPNDISWSDFNYALRERGVIVGGNYGELEGKVFRIGHMGTQAKADLVGEAMDIIGEVLTRLRENIRKQ